MNTLEVLVCEGLEREVVVAECLADVLFSVGPLVASDEVGKVRDVFGGRRGVEGGFSFGRGQGRHNAAHYRYAHCSWGCVSGGSSTITDALDVEGLEG